MERFLVLLSALCVLPSIASISSDSFVLKGYVKCDTCRCGFETNASKPLPGASVKLECRKRSDPTQVTYAMDFMTDSAGQYTAHINGDRGDDICDVLAVSSSDPECTTPTLGRDKARVSLTSNNGIATNDRPANALLFDRQVPLDNCAQILEQYQEIED